MILFIYDHTFEGLLTCIFDAYFRKTFPDLLLMEGEPLPLFYNEAIHIATDEEKAGRVWRGLQKKISIDNAAIRSALLVILLDPGTSTTQLIGLFNFLTLYCDILIITSVIILLAAL